APEGPPSGANSRTLWRLLPHHLILPSLCCLFVFCLFVLLNTSTLSIEFLFGIVVSDSTWPIAARPSTRPVSPIHRYQVQNAMAAIFPRADMTIVTAVWRC